MKRSPIKRQSARKRLDDAVYVVLRQMVLERDDYTCQGPARGLTGPCDLRLHVHHIRRRSQGGGHTLDNTVLLCQYHHTDGGRESVHGNPALAYDLGLLARSSA